MLVNPDCLFAGVAEWVVVGCCGREPLVAVSFCGSFVEGDSLWVGELLRK